MPALGSGPSQALCRACEKQNVLAMNFAAVFIERPAAV